MIQAETVKAVQQLLQDRGIKQRSEEPWGDYLARGLGVSDAKAAAFLEALHAGCSIAAAERAAGIHTGGRAVRFGRSVGIVFGRIRRHIAPIGKGGGASGVHTRVATSGATEDQVNMTLQQPQRIDDRGTKAEELAGTGEHDSLGG